MSVVVTSAAPETISTNGGTITLTGTFPDAESPFRLYWSNGIDVTEDLGLHTSDDEVTIVTTVSSGPYPEGGYTLSVVEEADELNYDFAFITVVDVPAEVTGVAPDVLTVNGGELTVQGVFDLGSDYYAELRGDGTIALGGPVQSEDGTTLVFTLDAEDALAGSWSLYVYELIDGNPIDIGGDASFTISTVFAPVTSQSRSTGGLLTALEQFRPEYYCGVRPLSAGYAAALALVEGGVDTLREHATIGLGTNIWLTLAARGQGILRATAESDASLRTRMRSVDDQVTRPALLATLNALLTPDEAILLEWFEHSYLDVELEGEGGLWLDTERLSGGPSSFLVLVPERGWLSAGTYLDADLWLDSSYLGTEVENGVYAAIINAVNRARAAGVFWRLCLIP